MNRLRSVMVMLVILAVVGPASGSFVADTEPNNSVAGAQNIDAYFSLDSSADIGNTLVNTSETIPHVTVVGTGNGTEDLDFFSFTVPAGARGIFDIDYGMPGLDSMISLFHPPIGLRLAFNDDSPSTTFGAGGSVDTRDSYLEYTFSSAGMYVIEVFRFWEVPLLSGQDYQLQVSIEGHPVGAVPEPSTAIMWSLFGGLGITVGWWRRRKSA